MAILRCLNEFVKESVVLALEPARICSAHCTYCFATINSKIQYANRSKSLKDDQSFERTLEKAYSPVYDPTNFLQWGIRNKLVLGYANTVEPFQNLDQAIFILTSCDKFDIPLFIQTKGINFDHVFKYLKPISDNSSIFVSFPSLDDKVAKRFEPGTPSIGDRLRMVERLADEGFWVIGALSPWHEEFIRDPHEIVDVLASAGASEIFADRMHLNERQYDGASDRVMAEMAGGRGKPWTQKAIDYLFAIREAAIDNGLEFYSNGFLHVAHGRYNTIPTISPDGCFSRGMPWVYHDGNIFQILQNSFYDYSRGGSINPSERDFNDSILFTWEDAITIMHVDGGIDQPFSYSSLMDVVPLYKKIPQVWKNAIGIKTTKDCAKMSEWYRCLWNCPYRDQFVHRHPWMRVAATMDGIPILDDQGNLMILFDPDYADRHERYFRKVEDINVFRRLNFDDPLEP